MWTAVPFDLQTLPSLERGPGIVGNHRDSAQRLKLVRWLDGVDCKSLLHSRDLEGSLVIVGLDLLAENGRMLNRGEDHAGHRGVHAENSFACDHVGKIKEGIAFLSDVAPFRARLEFEILCFRNRQLRRLGVQLAVAKFSAADR